MRLQVRDETVSRKLVNYNMKYYILNGVLYNIVVSLYKPYAQKFIYRLHGNDFYVSLYNALPGFIAIFAIIPGIILINKASSRKRIILGSFMASRMFILLFAVVPFLPVQYQAFTFVLLTSLMNFPDSISQTALQSVTGEIFDGDDCAAAITSRNKYLTFVGTITLIVLAAVLKCFGKSDGLIINIYQIFFVLAFILAIAEIWTFSRLKQVKATQIKHVNLKKVLPEMIKNKKYVVFTICSLIFYFGWQMGWPIFNIYQISKLGADEMWLTISNVISNLVMVLSFNYWKRLIIKKGNAYTIIFATFGMAITPLLYAVSFNLYVFTFMGLATGFFTAGTVVVVLSSLLEVVPDEDRDIYVAVQVTLTNITLAVSPLVGNFFLSISNIYIALVAVAIIRFVGSFAFYIRRKRNL